ncbi:hypothetical protein B484DRAFT_449764 [Ochromonadaceae sp. CCMP2298]|nr:hypothetical protein B484DRAFT_449764 [Ochromonadaceae sp. CCMP2298]
MENLQQIEESQLMETPVVLASGKKFFWRYRVSLEYMIVEHTSFDVLELITYDHQLDRESPRIYLRPGAILAAIGIDKLEQALLEAEAAKLRFNLVSDSHLFTTRESVTKLRTEYIVDKLDILEYSHNPISFHVRLNANYRDAEEVASILCSKPDNLQRFVSPHHQKLLEGEAEDKRLALEKACAEVVRFSNVADEYQQRCGDALMTVRELWRTPIVCVKMQNGCRLSGGDSQIWDKVMAKVWTPAKAEAATTSGGGLRRTIVRTASNVLLDSIASLHNMLSKPILAEDHKKTAGAGAGGMKTGAGEEDKTISTRYKPAGSSPLTGGKIPNLRSKPGANGVLFPKEGKSPTHRRASRRRSIGENLSRGKAKGKSRRGSVQEEQSGRKVERSAVGRLTRGLSNLLLSVTGRTEGNGGNEEGLKGSVRTVKTGESRECSYRQWGRGQGWGGDGEDNGPEDAVAAQSLPVTSVPSPLISRTILPRRASKDSFSPSNPVHIGFLSETPTAHKSSGECDMSGDTSGDTSGDNDRSGDSTGRPSENLPYSTHTSSSRERLHDDAAAVRSAQPRRQSKILPHSTHTSSTLERIHDDAAAVRSAQPRILPYSDLAIYIPGPLPLSSPVHVGFLSGLLSMKPMDRSGESGTSGDNDRSGDSNGSPYPSKNLPYSTHTSSTLERIHDDAAAVRNARPRKQSKILPYSDLAINTRDQLLPSNPVHLGFLSQRPITRSTEIGTSRDNARSGDSNGSPMNLPYSTHTSSTLERIHDDAAAVRSAQPRIASTQPKTPLQSPGKGSPGLSVETGLRWFELGLVGRIREENL